MYRTVPFYSPNSPRKYNKLTAQSYTACYADAMSQCWGNVTSIDVGVPIDTTVSTLVQQDWRRPKPVDARETLCCSGTQIGGGREIVGRGRAGHGWVCTLW